jgi:predicted O-linked N-acetylglucosamine transferase (SPINDLY family)
MGRSRNRNRSKNFSEGFPFANTQSRLDLEVDLFQQARMQLQSGQLDLARYFCEQILLINPRHFEVIHFLGVIAYQSKNSILAVDLISQALEINPLYDFAYNNLGIVLQDLNRLDEALANYDKALELNPDFVGAHYNRSKVLQALQRLDEALASYDRTLALDPNFADGHYNRGNLLSSLKRLDEALVSYDQALALSPDSADAHNNRGSVLNSLGYLDEALASYDRTLALNPSLAEAHNNRGNVLKDLKRLDEALASYNKALELNPKYEYVLGAALHTQMMMCDWSCFDERLKQITEGIGLSEPVTYPFGFLGLLDSPALQLEAAKIYARNCYRGHSYVGNLNPRTPNGKIRIGYYSADFHNHATAYLIAELFEMHDRSRFELVGFSFGSKWRDEMGLRVAASFEHFIDVTSMSDLEIARLSRDMGIDIAVDLKGFTKDSRPGIFIERAAPIQVNYLGYPGTMGASYIDYIIADEIVIPQESQGYYTEKVVYLPHSYQVNDSTRKISDRKFTREDEGLPLDGFVFCCFNNNWKILPATFDSWMRILKATKGSVLWLLEDNQLASSNLRKEAEARGVCSKRLIFAKRLPLDEHLARLRLADLFIDTLPYNAHTTTSDSLWAGLPVLTCIGQSFSSRVASSLLNSIDLPELITETRISYEDKAIELATYPKTLFALRNRLERNRQTSPLFNCKLFAKNIEAAYETMYQTKIYADWKTNTRSAAKHD